MAIVLGDNRFGKAEVRMLHLHRDAERSVLTDLSVSTHLSGSFEAVHLIGDNTNILTTDAQKNTVFAFAKEQAPGEPEAFGLRLARHFTASVASVDRSVVEVESYGWDRLLVSGSAAPHAFSRAGERRLARITCEGGDEWVVSGLTDLVLLRSEGSEFHGFLTERYTTLPETDDRILATAVTARWRHCDSDSDWAVSFRAVREILLETFATAPSLSLQQTLYCMGGAVLEQRPEVVEIRLAMPNRHHFVADLSPFGLDNAMPGAGQSGEVVFTVPDRPYGLIEGCVLHDDVASADHAW